MTSFHLLLTTLFALLAAGLPSKLDTQSATATITFARNTQCIADNTPTTHVGAGAGCVAFPEGVQSLRVVGVSEGNGLRYNSRACTPSFLPFFLFFL